MSRQWLLDDERGSIIAGTSASGQVQFIDSYDEYGQPGAANTGRFQYTGQAWIPEAGAYDYRARFYLPSIGRFLQTDPSGYGAGMNLYAYAGVDPVNNFDPMGLDWTCTTMNPNPSCPPEPFSTGSNITGAAGGYYGEAPGSFYQLGVPGGGSVAAASGAGADGSDGGAPHFVSSDIVVTANALPMNTIWVTDVNPVSHPGVTRVRG